MDNCQALDSMQDQALFLIRQLYGSFMRKIEEGGQKMVSCYIDILCACVRVYYGRLTLLLQFGLAFLLTFGIVDCLCLVSFVFFALYNAFLATNFWVPRFSFYISACVFLDLLVTSHSYWLGFAFFFVI